MTIYILYCVVDPTINVSLIDGNEHRVSDSQLSASSSHPHCAPYKSRLNSDGFPAGAAWCPMSGTNEWIQVLYISYYKCCLNNNNKK